MPVRQRRNLSLRSDVLQKRSLLATLAVLAITAFCFLVLSQEALATYPWEVVLVPDQAWEDNAVWDPAVLYDNGQYRMWYAYGQLGNSPIGIAHAESSDGVNWTNK